MKRLTGIVTPTSLKAVLGQKAYMLFYVKRSLAYVQQAPRLMTNGSTTTIPSANANANANANGSANGTANSSVSGH